MKDLTSLTRLDLEATAVTDAGLAHLKGLSQLEKLSARIQTRQTELTDLKSKQKEVKTQLADAKKAEKEKAQAAKAK